MLTPADLPDDIAALKAMLIAERMRAERLEQIIKELRPQALMADVREHQPAVLPVLAGKHERAEHLIA